MGLKRQHLLQLQEGIKNDKNKCRNDWSLSNLLFVNIFNNILKFTCGTDQLLRLSNGKQINGIERFYWHGKW